MRMTQLFAALCAYAVIGAIAPAAHAEAFRVGMLVCDTGPRVGRIVGSTQSMRCVFHSNTHADRRYIYEGRIRRAGLDIGATTSGGTLSWVVFSRNSRIGSATLRGSYVGASGSVAVGFGVGANILVGGSRRSIALQPLSVERSTGLNLAAGVSNLTLRARGTRR